MRKFKGKPIVLFLIAIALLYVIIYIIPSVTGALVSSYIVEYDELKISDETTAYLVREEQAYTSATSGKANRYIEEGTLVRVGTTVMEVTAGEDSEVSTDYTDLLSRMGSDSMLTADFSVAEGGVISYYADGYEQKLTPENMKKKSYSFYSKLTQDSVMDLTRDNIAKGEPVFKVVDRTKWYMVCFVDKSHLDRYKKGQKVRVEFEDDYVEAEVYSAKEADDLGRVILETDYYYEAFSKTRVAEVSIVTYDKRGLVIENSSICEEDGMQGVYIKNKSKDYVFVPVQVIKTDGEHSLIKDTTFTDEETGKTYNTVEIYDEILKNPK